MAANPLLVNERVPSVMNLPAKDTEMKLRHAWKIPAALAVLITLIGGVFMYPKIDICEYAGDFGPCKKKPDPPRFVPSLITISNKKPALVCGKARSVTGSFYLRSDGPPAGLMLSVGDGGKYDLRQLGTRTGHIAPNCVLELRGFKPTVYGDYEASLMEINDE